MVRLSVNLNKIALIRNARGGKLPDLSEAAIRAEQYGAHGITVHPRPDQRHVTYADVLELKAVVKTEFNVEGYPDRKFLDVVCKVKPDQVTLVPDAPDALTSNAGWNTLSEEGFLKEVISELKRNGIRTSLFMDTDIRMYDAAAATGADRLELYTEAYAVGFSANKDAAVKPYTDAAIAANSLGLGLNAGHDLNSLNLGFLQKKFPISSKFRSDTR